MRHGIAALALACCTPINGAWAQETSADNRALVPLEVFQKNEDRLFRIGYLLSTSNSRFCESGTKVSGLLIHDAGSYGNPAAVRATFHLEGDIGVQSVAPDSPAAVAGLTQNSTILAINGIDVAKEWPQTDPPWKRVFAIRDFIDSSLNRGPIEITWKPLEGPARTAAIEGTTACPTRFELIASDKSAAADGDRVLVGENFPGLSYGEAEFAAAIAHEMAHNILRHPQSFRELGWKRKLVRLSERDADRLMPWLLQNAGYDPRSAIEFMRKWGPRHGGWIFRKRTHDGWDERVEYIEAELPKIEAVLRREESGSADWATYFDPEFK